MAGLEQEGSTSVGNEYFSIQLHSACVDDQKGHQWKPTSIAAACMSQRWNFYLGNALTVVGIVMFLAGACSNQWLVLADDRHETAPHRDKLLAYLGPWKACTHGGDCDLPWRISPGLGERDRLPIQGIQGILVLSMLAYLFGAAAIFLKLACGTKLIQTSSVLNKVLRVAVPEFYISSAAVLGIMSMLAMGLIKQRMLPHDDQTLHPGWAFFVCIVAIILTVLGAVLILSYRHLVPSEPGLLSGALGPVVDCWRRRNDEGLEGRNKRRWRGRFWRRDSIPHAQLEESEMEVAVVRVDPRGGSVGGEGGDSGGAKTREREKYSGNKGNALGVQVGSGEIPCNNDHGYDTSVFHKRRDAGAAADVSVSHNAVGADGYDSDQFKDIAMKPKNATDNSNVAIPREQPHRESVLFNQTTASHTLDQHAEWSESRTLADSDSIGTSQAAMEITHEVSEC